MSTQTDPNAAYNAKVQEIAEELMGLCFSEFHARKNIENDKWYEAECERLVEICTPAARARVAEMAKTFEQAYFLNLHHDPSDPVFNVWHEQCDRIMQERGLIPNTKTDKEQKMTYQERVVIMAKKIQKASPLVGHWTLYKEATKEAVAAQAEAIREFAYVTYTGSHAQQLLDRYLLEHGYIEPKTEEDGKM